MIATGNHNDANSLRAHRPKGEPRACRASASNFNLFIIRQGPPNVNDRILEKRDAPPDRQKKKDTLTDVLFVWWARRDLNPHVRSEH